MSKKDLKKLSEVITKTMFQLSKQNVIDIGTAYLIDVTLSDSIREVFNKGEKHE